MGIGKLFTEMAEKIIRRTGGNLIENILGKELLGNL